MIVLLRWRERLDARPDDVTVHALLADQEALDAKMFRIAKANSQYRLRPIGKEPHRMWRIGPDEDEGFFGNTPMFFKAVEVVAETTSGAGLERESTS